MTDSPRFIPVTETAKLIRKQLKQKFPDTRFIVRSSRYAHGASIHISYGPDGPDRAFVELLCRSYQGKRFNGMTDTASRNYHWLINERVPVIAKAGGQGTGFKAIATERPSPDAEFVQFGADYVFVHRDRPVEEKRSCPCPGVSDIPF